MVEDIDDKDEFDNKDDAKCAAAAQVRPPLPTVPIQVATGMAQRWGS